MTSSRNITLDLPLHGSGPDYAEAIALAIADATYRGDANAARALAGLMSALELPALHNPIVELGPWLAAI